MEGFGFPLGGDPEDLMRGLREFAERQTEAMQESQPAPRSAASASRAPWTSRRLRCATR